MLIKTSKTTARRLGRTRSEQATNLRRVWGGSGGITDENLDKLKYIERKSGMSEGFIPQAHIDDLVKQV